EEAISTLRDQVDPRTLGLGLLGRPVHRLTARALEVLLRQLDLRGNPWIHLGPGWRQVSDRKEAWLIASEGRRSLLDRHLAVAASASSAANHGIDLTQSLGDRVHGDGFLWLSGVEHVHHATSSVQDNAVSLSLLALNLRHHDTNSLVADATDGIAGCAVLARAGATAKSLGGDRVRLCGLLRRAVRHRRVERDWVILAAGLQHPDDFLLRCWPTLQRLAAEAGGCRRILS